MKYFSTRGNSEALNFIDVLTSGTAKDGGLYVPENFPKFSKEEIADFETASYQDLASHLLYPYVEGFLSKDDFEQVVKNAYESFTIPEVVKLVETKNIGYVLELFHGPTFAFKDIAMQLLAALLDKAAEKTDKKIVVLGATSGDTGAAAIDAIKGKKNMNIFVLHPNNKISKVQRRLMTTVKENNVFNIAVEGNFDNCQNLVKAMFSDLEFSKSIKMTGVNSINWARIIAQAVYYFYTCFKLNSSKPISFSVPTGNFGDVFAGYLAKKMGLPIDKLIVATNQNDILHRAISKGEYISKKVEQTISPSMDIQLASNFERLIYYINNSNSEITAEIMKKIKENVYQIDKINLESIQKDFVSGSCNENETLDIIKKYYEKDNVILDPHTAVGVGVANKLSLNDCVVLSTAHPCKFPDATENAIKKYENLPKELEHVLNKDENFEVLKNDIEVVKNFVRSKI